MKPLQRVILWAKEHSSYKLVALFVGIVLWLSVKGEKDTLQKTIPLELRLGARQVLVNNVVTSIRLDVVGPRVALKKMRQSYRPYVVDLKNLGYGRREVIIRRDEFDLPYGVRVLSIDPSVIVVHLDSVENRERKLRELKALEEAADAREDKSEDKTEDKTEELNSNGNGNSNGNSNENSGTENGSHEKSQAQ